MLVWKSIFPLPHHYFWWLGGRGSWSYIGVINIPNKQWWVSWSYELTFPATADRWKLQEIHLLKFHQSCFVPQTFSDTSVFCWCAPDNVRIRSVPVVTGPWSEPFSTHSIHWWRFTFPIETAQIGGAGGLFSKTPISSMGDPRVTMGFKTKIIVYDWDDLGLRPFLETPSQIIPRN